MSEHAPTPRPWRKGKNSSILGPHGSIAWVGELESDPEDAANRDLILLAVNAHDGLMTACKAALALNDWHKTSKQIRAALAAAEQETPGG